MSIEAMKQALVALHSANPIGHALEDYEYHNKATEALRQAIEQSEKQEPVAYIDSNTIEWFLNPKRGKDSFASPTLTKKPSLYCDTPLYTAPPKREWVSLTDEEIHDEALKLMREHKTGHMGIARSIEAKLKEKNT